MKIRHGWYILDGSYFDHFRTWYGLNRAREECRKSVRKKRIGFLRHNRFKQNRFSLCSCVENNNFRHLKFSSILLIPVPRYCIYAIRFFSYWLDLFFRRIQNVVFWFIYIVWERNILHNLQFWLRSFDVLTYNNNGSSNCIPARYLCPVFKTVKYFEYNMD